MSDNIKVVVKVRPLISREIEEKLSYQWRVSNNTLYQLDQNGRDLGQSFTFDKVYDKETKTSDVYNDIAKPIVEAATAGFNGTIFAYGQTSSGKTYTMTGTENSPGIIPLAVFNLFDIIKKVPNRDFLVRVSYIEIYNETVKDLLNVEKENIKIHETFQGIKVDVKEKVTSSPEEVLQAMREGEANRQKGATNMNEESSRSHSIFQITIESREHFEGENEGGCVNVSQLNLVDLAGSERAGQTGATGKRFKEGTHINKSLSSLALVIKQLSEDPNKFANYRDSKLTRILQNSLGGNAKTSIICAITPAAVEETISTLQFANRAKAIKNKPEVNAVATDATMIQQLTKQMSRLQSQLESKKNLEQDNYKLQQQINALQSLILNGFQRRSFDMMGDTRRKLQQPRRVTIHSTITTTEEEPAAIVPKFRTPSLKYNPMAISASDFVPIQSSNKLPSVPEEPARLQTPTPHKAVYFSGEVIELDSDDDSVHEDHETCSPIHKCYGSSKTPPCILRKNARKAEKDLKDIVELTEREKIFSPSTVELMEKLEENSATIIKLKDEIELLNKQSREKDLQLDALEIKIKECEEEFKAVCSSKMELQALCENYSTKLTDKEVSYETLKRKAKLREEELLSLLEEFKVKKTADIGIVSQKLQNEINVLKMSKDISLVNRDNENNGDDSDANENSIINLQEQLAAKNHFIIDIETNLFAHKQNIELLENLTKELKEKIVNIETENSVLKSTIHNLNTTINNQKESLKSAHNDMESYNSLIQELQIKIQERDNMLKLNIDDNALENMIANEKQFISNNDNMMNIIQSFKNTIRARNKEIAELNTKYKDNCDAINKDLLCQLQTKTHEIGALNFELENLKKQINDNTEMIKKLTIEISDHKIIEQELSEKLCDVQNKNIELLQIRTDNEMCIQNLKRENDRLLSESRERVEEITNKIASLEQIITEKDNIIDSLSKYELVSEDNLLKAKSSVLKTQTILHTLSGNMQEVPEIIDNFVNIFTILSDSLNSLEVVASAIMTEKEETKKINDKLRADLQNHETKCKPEINLLRDKLENISNSQSIYEQQKEELILTINNLNRDLESLREEINITTASKNMLQAKLDKVTELRNQEMLSNDVKQKEIQQISIEKDNKICYLTNVLEEINSKIKKQELEILAFKEQIKEVHKENAKIFSNVYNKVIDITKQFNIENNLRVTSENSNVMYEEILFTLDKICNHITFITLKNAEGDNNKIEEILTEAKNEIVNLTQKNLNLINKISAMESKNKELLSKVEQSEDTKKILTKELSSTQLILKDLELELNFKASEIASMEVKVKQWKEQFQTLDTIMKQQMNEMTLDNENLKARIKELNTDSRVLLTTHDSNYKADNDSQDGTSNNRILELNTNVDKHLPLSLVTICCNRILDFMEPKESESQTSTSSGINILKESPMNICRCTQLSLELIAAKEENSRIMDLLSQMETINISLQTEQDLLRNEIQLLLKPVQELQKKIVNHRTNLSILTATTYAENKSLKSQVKVLQHHHNRFHSVCQRDIPEFKKQLSGLMTLLKGENYIYEQDTAFFQRQFLPDMLDNSSLLPLSHCKNESTLDGDLLMLDTNVTLTTAADNTLTCHDQTGFDATQYYNEICLSTELTDNNIRQMNNLIPPHEHFVQQIVNLKEDNAKLREILSSYSEVKELTVNAQNIHVKKEHNLESICKTAVNYECINCQKLKALEDSHCKISDEVKSLTEELQNVKVQKTEIEKKYNNLILEIPSIEILVRKNTSLEKDYNNQKLEIDKLNNSISLKNKELKSLQEENETLSNQVMDNISEADNLNKEIDSLKQKNKDLVDKCNLLESACIVVNKKLIDIKGGKEVSTVCSQCVIKEQLIERIQSKATTPHAKLSRSLSDSDTSSRHNTICTLQSELHAGREDCRELQEDVVTIKNHLECSNISMDLDESTYDRLSNKCNMPEIPEECNLDIYLMDKLDCINYYIEISGAQKNDLHHDVKIIEVMKMLYEYLISKHASDLENITNQLKIFEVSKHQLQHEYCNLIEKHTQMSKELGEKDKKYSKVENILSQIRNNINSMNEQLNGLPEKDNIKLINSLKNNLFLMDNEFGLSNAKTFDWLIDSMVNKHEANLSEITDKYTKLQEHLETVTEELNSVNSNLVHMKDLLSAKENELDLLKAKNEKVHEISNAVTLDIVKREKELKDTIDKGYQTLINHDIVTTENVNLNLSLNININKLFELLVKQKTNYCHIQEKEKATLLLEISNLESAVIEKEKAINLLNAQCGQLQEVNNVTTIDLDSKKNQLKQLQTAHNDLNRTYQNKVAENKIDLMKLEKLNEEVQILKGYIADKENIVDHLEKELLAKSQNQEKIFELLETIKDLQEDNTNMKSLNEMINKERNSYAEELQKAGEAIKKNNMDLDKMTTDLLTLRESVKENSVVIENLRAEAKSLLIQNKELKELLETKSRECSRLETNIKTHEKTAQIQTRMIMRLEKQKTDDNKLQSEMKQQLADVTQKCLMLEEQSETSKLEIDQLRKHNEGLQTRITELEASLEAYKNRLPIDAVAADSSRRRRQSLQDFRRITGEDKYNNEELISAETTLHPVSKHDESADIDENMSNRSTPIRLSKGRDSLSTSRTDQSDKDEEHSSRPSSVMEIRRRRQTLHDSHRGEMCHTPTTLGESDSSTVTQLREQLGACQQELQELRERNKELDLSCESLAEYYRERDERCAGLVNEKRVLQKSVKGLKQQLQSVSPNRSQVNPSKPTVAHACINTDEDWTNLHSVVVDRMSYDAEVEKNKKLTKTIEELRFQKQDLKHVIDKMQKALERNNGGREQETVKLELQTYKRELENCKQELSQLQENYKALDEECETCAQYLREREEQCRKLRIAKEDLEIQLREVQKNVGSNALSARKKRQSVHDQNRSSTVSTVEVATQTTDDLLSYLVERDRNTQAADDKQAREVKHLKLAVERLLKQKETLEQQLKSTTNQAPQPMYVATGSAIVQNQQITDIMKENQKLKKMNAKLINICKKRGKDSNRENEEPANQN